MTRVNHEARSQPERAECPARRLNPRSDQVRSVRCEDQAIGASHSGAEPAAAGTRSSGWILTSQG